MSHRLREASFAVSPGRSVIVPFAIAGLPAAIEALGVRWNRKREFHLTALSADVVDGVSATRGDAWAVVTDVLAGRSLNPVTATPEVRRACHPGKPGLQTLIVMVQAPGLAPIYADLSRALGVPLEEPPAHVTIYSTDGTKGIGIRTERELVERAPPLGEAEQQEVRVVMDFDRVFGDDDPSRPTARS